MRVPNIRPLLVLLGLTAAAVAGVACHGGLHFTVNSTGDAGDQTINGTCRTSGGVCTLRAAIQEANGQSGHDLIGFTIPGDGVHTISPSSQLPALTDTAGVTIDGYTEPGSAVNTSATASNAVIKIQLQGQGPNGIDGLKLQSPDNVVRGLAIREFVRQLHLFVSNADSNEILGNFIGTDAAGTAGAAVRNTASQGMVIQNGASGNLIGKPGNAHRNVISGNYGNGVGMYNAGTDDNLVRNNLVGLRPDGAAGLRNWNHGVDINAGAANNVVGGPTVAERNVISGNGASGVEISHDPGTLRNDVVGNRIGTRADGTAAPSYARNAQYGVFLEGLAQCTSSCRPDAGDSTVSGNVIVNSGGGVAVQKGRHDDVIVNNRIGVLSNGASAANSAFGVRIEIGSNDTTVGPDNVISRNGGGGVQVQATGSNPTTSTQFPTLRNTITRNRISLNSGLGIDLAPLGQVTANPGNNVNGSVDIPGLSRTGSEVRALTCSNCTAELFIADTTATDVNGEGAQFVASDQANRNGVAVFDAGAVSGRVVTATTTDTDGNTSEFSRNLAVPS